MTAMGIVWMAAACGYSGGFTTVSYTHLGYSENYYHRTGCMVNAIYPFFKLMWLKELGFDLSRYRIAGQGVYNTFRMTGYNVVTECTLSGTGLMNIFTKQYEQELLDILGVNDGNLPEIVPYNRSYPLQGEAAKALGLKAGIPVIPTNSDGGLNQIGAGAVSYTHLDVYKRQDQPWDHNDLPLPFPGKGKI